MAVGIRLTWIGVLRILAEHAEQPPHFGQACPRGVADLQ
jgi:hypothetical protein